MIKVHTIKHRGRPTYHGYVSIWDNGYCLYKLHADAERLTREDARADAEMTKADLLEQNGGKAGWTVGVSRKEVEAFIRKIEGD